MVNSEEYVSEDQVDDPRWEPSSGSESGELVEGDDSSGDETLKRIRALRVSTQRTQDELLESYQQRLEYAEQMVTDLYDRLDKADKYAREVTSASPLHALMASLDHEEAQNLAENKGCLALVTGFMGLFADLSKRLVKGEKEGLPELEALVSRKIWEMLRGDKCLDRDSIVHERIPRGSKFLKDGSVLLPDQRLIPYDVRITINNIGKAIKNLPKHWEEIPFDRFVGTDPVTQDSVLPFSKK
jgi:hypothetical protein